MSSEIIKYLLVGTGSNALNFLLYTTIFYFTEILWFASISGYALGLFLSYTGARIWIFGQVFESTPKLLAAFCMVYVVGGIGMTLLIIFLTQEGGLDYRFSWLIGALFAVVNNFFGQKLFVFRVQDGY